jgi:hypothetical protein
MVENAGLQYEKKVHRALKDAYKLLEGKPYSVKQGSGGFNANECDLVLQLGKSKINIEIKANKNAQMGGSSLTYSMDKDRFIDNKGYFDIDTLEIIHKIAEQKKFHKNFDNLFKFLQKQYPVDYHKEIEGIPFACNDTAWNEALKMGLMKPLNFQVKQTTRFIDMHYESKGVDYIQIGGQGLFYLNKNPLNLDVPKLVGDIDIELRPVSPGKKPLLKYKINYVRAALRCQARLKTTSRSKHTLDTAKGVVDLFKSM